MLRRSSSAGKRDRAAALRNAGHFWPVINPDIIVEVAGQCDALSLSRLPAVCRGWRDAVAADLNYLWASPLRARFPRAFAALELLPEAACDYRDIYRDQQSAAVQPVHQYAAPLPVCSLSDFVFTFELISDSTTLKFPAHPRDAVTLYVKDHEQQYEKENPGLAWPIRNSTLNSQYRQLPQAAKQPYIERAAEEKARFEKAIAEYEINEAAALSACPVVSSWTGNLDTLPRRGGDECRFRVPILWDKWHDAWEMHGQMTPIRLRIFVSRIFNGKLRTLPIMISERGCDDAEVDTMCMWAKPLRYHQNFAHDDYRITPELGFEFHTIDLESDEGFEREPQWNCSEIVAGFELYLPGAESHSDPMTKLNLLNYLEGCLPWGA